MKVSYKIVINHKNVPKMKFSDVCVDSLVHLQFGLEKIVTKVFISFSKLIWVKDYVFLFFYPQKFVPFKYVH